MYIDLSHTSLTRATPGSYVGPLGNFIYENNAVVYGEEEAIGGQADYEAQVARLPQYLPFVVRGVVTDVERAERVCKVVAHHPKLSPYTSTIVDVDPTAVVSNRVKVDVDDECCRSAWRERE